MRLTPRRVRRSGVIRHTQGICPGLLDGCAEVVVPNRWFSAFVASSQPRRRNYLRGVRRQQKVYAQAVGEGTHDSRCLRKPPFASRSFFLRPSSPPSEHFCPPPSSPASCPLPSAPQYSPSSQEEEVEIESAQASCTAGDADRSRISSLFARGRGCELGRGGRLASEHGHRRLRR